MTMTLIETKTLGTAAASIEFTSIPQDGTDLVFLISSRSATTDNFDLALRFNGSTTGYSNRQLQGNGSAVASAAPFSDRIWLGYTNPSFYTSNTFGNSIAYIPNYTAAVNKSVSGDTVMENNATSAFQFITAGLWSNTAAITSVNVSIDFGTGNFAIGTTVSLYKITKGSDGIVTTS